MVESKLDCESCVILIFCIIGLWTLFKPVYKLVKWVYCMFLRPPKKLTNYGSWALITGSTDGIGKALTYDLASRGFNLILVGRNPIKLKSTSNEINEKFGQTVEIKIIVIDFGEVSGEQLEEQIKKDIQGLDVGVLVNNVGSAVKGARFLHEVDFEGLNELVKVNIGSVTWVTKAVLPGMLRRKKGAIVNIGSGSSVAVPSYPLFTIYAATKAYVAMFSKSLQVEYKQHGIDIQCQIPFLVATKMAALKRSSFFVPSPKQYSKGSMRWIGYDSLCVPCWTHALQWCLMDVMPDSLMNWLLLRYFLNLRKKVLQKESMTSSLRQKN